MLDGDLEGEDQQAAIDLCNEVVSETSRLKLYGSWLDSFSSLCGGTQGTPYFKECLPDPLHAYMLNTTRGDCLWALPD